MSVSRFAAGVGAGAAIAALLAGAATMGGPTAAEPEGAAVRQAAEPKPSAPAVARSVSASSKEEIERGVLARAAASRRAKAAPGGAAATPAGTAASATGGAKQAAANGTKETTIESIEVDWGGQQPRP